MELLLLELLRVLSLSMSILMIPFEIGPWEGFLILAISMAIAAFFLWQNIRKKPWSLVLIPLVALMPLLLSWTVERVYFSLLYSGVLYAYYEVRLGILDPKDLSQRFKVSYGMLLFLGLTAASAEGIQWILLKNLPFLLLYFFSTILLSVSLRHKEAGIDPKKSRDKIVLYLLASVFGAVFLGTEEARGLFYGLVQRIGSFLFILFSYVVYPFAFIFYAVFSKLKGFFRPPDFENAEGADLGEGFQEEFSTVVGKAGEYPILRTVLSVLLILGFIYLLYRFLRKKGEKPVEGLEYIEERESIKEKKTKRSRTIKEKEPQGIYEKFRYRYRTYLFIMKKQMEIHPYDTAHDVAQRAKHVSVMEHDKIMKAYQEVRYGDKVVTDELLEHFSQYMENNQNGK